MKGVWTATGAARGPYLYAGALAIGGFVSSQAGETVAQSDSAVTAVRLAFSLVPAAIMVVAAVVQRRYSLDERARVATLSTAEA